MGLCCRKPERPSSSGERQWAQHGHLPPCVPVNLSPATTPRRRSSPTRQLYAGAARPPILPSKIRSRTAIDELTSRRNVGIREKTLWRMLYETAARAE